MSDTTAPTAPKVPKAVKAPFTIDFSGPGPSTKTLFASSSKASITLPKEGGIPLTGRYAFQQSRIAETVPQAKVLCTSPLLVS